MSGKVKLASCMQCNNHEENIVIGCREIANFYLICFLYIFGHFPMPSNVQ